MGFQTNIIRGTPTRRYFSSLAANVRVSHRAGEGAMVTQVGNHQQYQVLAPPRVVSSSTVLGNIFAVLVTQVGGSQGTATTQASWTYDVDDLNGDPLGTAMTPKRRRPSLGEISPPPADTEGLGYYDDAGDFQLYSANEVPVVDVCP